MAQDVVRVTLNAAVADGAAFFAPYPDDRNSDMYAVDGHYIRSNRYGTQHHGEDATFVFGLDGATITNESGEDFAIGTVFFVNLVFAEAEEGSTVPTQPVNVEPQLNALRADFADASNDADKGAKAVGYYNVTGEEANGATTVQAVLKWLIDNGLFGDDAGDAVQVNALAAGDGVTLFGVTGEVKYIEASLLFGATPQKVVKSADTSGDVAAADVGNTIIVEASTDATRSFKLQSEEEMVVGSVVTYLNRCGGTFAVNCDDPTIRVNEAQDGSVSCSRGQEIVCKNIGPDDWSVLVRGAAADTPPPTTDTTPPAVASISPAQGSTLIAGTGIRVKFTEGIKAGTGNITQEQDSGGGFGADGTIDVTDPFGTTAGKINIIGDELFIYPFAQVEGDDYRFVIPSGAITDLASPTPNDFAGATIGPFTIAESSTAGIEVVNATPFVISPGSVVGATHTRTMSATPANGDMTIVFSSCIAQILAGLPDGMTAILDNAENTNPGCFAAYRVEGVTPSADIAFKTVSNRLQAAGGMILRGSGLAISGGAFKGNPSAVENADAAAYTPLTDGETVIAAYFIDTKDLVPVTTDLEAAGFEVQFNHNTGQGSSTAGATLVVATKDNCPVGVPVDPPAIGSGAVVYRTFTFGVKKTA